MLFIFLYCLFCQKTSNKIVIFFFRIGSALCFFFHCRIILWIKKKNIRVGADTLAREISVREEISINYILLIFNHMYFVDSVTSVADKPLF